MKWLLVVGLAVAGWFLFGWWGALLGALVGFLVPMIFGTREDEPPPPPGASGTGNV